MLTIVLGTAVGVAVVLYSVKPRQIGASQSFVSGGSSVETFSLPAQSSSFSQNDASAMPEVAATQSPVVEAPVEEVHATFSGSVATVTAGVAVASQSGSAIASVSAPAATVEVESHASSARSHRAPRKSSASSRTQAKPRAAGSRATRARLD